MKKLKLKTAVIFLTAVMLNAILFAQMSSQQVDSIMNHAMSTFNVAGSAIAIVKDGEIIFSKGYGVKSVITNEKGK